MDKYIKILELGESFDLKDLKKAYRKMAMKYHPDFAKTESEKIRFNKKMQQINEANEVLKEYLESNGRYTKHKTSSNNSYSKKTNSQQTNSNNTNSQTKTSTQTNRNNSNFKSNHNRESKTEFKSYDPFKKSSIYKNTSSDINWKNIFTIVLVIILCSKCIFHEKPVPPEQSNNDIVQEQVIDEQEYYNEDIDNYEEDTAYEEQENTATNTASLKEPIKQQTVDKKETRTTKQPSKAAFAQVQNRNQEFVDYKRERLIQDTDLGAQARITTDSNAARKYANKYITPKIQDEWQKSGDKPQTDNLTFSVYIDLYGQLRYIQITKRANYQITEQIIREAINYSTFPDLYYVNLGGDVKITYNAIVENGELKLQVIRALNLVW